MHLCECLALNLVLHEDDQTCSNECEEIPTAEKARQVCAEVTLKMTVTIQLQEYWECSWNSR